LVTLSTMMLASMRLGAAAQHVPSWLPPWAPSIRPRLNEPVHRWCSNGRPHAFASGRSPGRAEPTMVYIGSRFLLAAIVARRLAEFREASSPASTMSGPMSTRSAKDSGCAICSATRSCLVGTLEVLDLDRPRRHGLEDHEVLCTRHRRHDGAVLRVGTRCDGFMFERGPCERDVKLDVRRVMPQEQDPQLTSARLASHDVAPAPSGVSPVFAVHAPTCARNASPCAQRLLEMTGIQGRQRALVDVLRQAWL
jgi:hypothetical protein